MAHAIIPVYLGYEEEQILEKNITLLNYSTNKIGGYPDWPSLDINFSVRCPLCQLHRLLVVQCYAPLESSPYHRTLYVFACVSPNCWTESESWTCIRSQILDESYNSTASKSACVAIPTETNTTWCSGADEWDENDNGDAANGNVMNVDCQSKPNDAVQRCSDDDDESNSLDVDNMEQALGGLQIFDSRNANMLPVQGAVGAAGAPMPAAELEGGDEPDLVTVDTPTGPHHDLQALLSQTAELPVDLRTRLTRGPAQFIPKYIYVEQEVTAKNDYSPTDDRVDELLNKYKRESGDGALAVDNELASPGAGGGDEEAYEEARPLHGDRLFHNFLTRLRLNPGQILRYSRGAPPLLGAPLSVPDKKQPVKCRRCGARLVCEIQLMPNLASALSVQGVSLGHLQFLSVLVFTCVDSCWVDGDKYVQEAVIVQPEIL